MSEEFFIGYIPKMPKSIKRTIHIFVFGLCLAGLGLAIMFAASQNPFADSYFEFGNIKEFEGTLQVTPVPFLLVDTKTESNGLPVIFRYPLVGEGKFGVGQEVIKNDGKRVSLKGTLAYRDGMKLIEVVTDSVSVQDGSNATRTEPVDLGEMTLSGEIIDSKCYLGVMNPGNKKTHRDCAVACLRGGIPALFVVKDDSGRKSELWLLSETGKAVNEQILEYVAEPVRLNGRVSRNGDQLFFFADIAGIKRL